MTDHTDDTVDPGTANAGTAGNMVKRDSTGRFVPGTRNVWRKGGRPPKSLDDMAEQGAEMAIAWAEKVLKDPKSSATDKRHAVSTLAKLGVRRVTAKAEEESPLSKVQQAALSAALAMLPIDVLRRLATGSEEDLRELAGMTVDAEYRERE